MDLDASKKLVDRDDTFWLAVGEFLTKFVDGISEFYNLRLAHRSGIQAPGKFQKLTTLVQTHDVEELDVGSMDAPAWKDVQDYLKNGAFSKFRLAARVPP